MEDNDDWIGEDTDERLALHHIANEQAALIRRLRAELSVISKLADPARMRTRAKAALLLKVEAA